PRAIVEIPVSTEIALVVYGLVEVVRPVRGHSPVVLLRLVAGAGEIPVPESGHDLVAENRLDRGPAHVPLAAVMVRRVDDGVGGDLWLEDGRHGLRLA